MSFSLQWLEMSPPAPIPKTPRELGAVHAVVTCIAAHPQNDILLLGTTSGGVVVWDPALSKMTHQLPLHTKDVTRIQFAADGSQFLTASADGFVYTWDAQFNRLQEFAAGCPVFAAVFGADNGVIVAGGEDRQLRVWDARSGVLQQQLPPQSEVITGCLWLSKNLVIGASADGSLYGWEVDSRRSVRQQRPHQQRIVQLLPSHSGNWFVTAAWDGAIKVWNQQSRERFALPAGDQPVTAVSLTEDDKILAASHWNGTVRLWNMESGRQIDEFTAHANNLIGCTFVAGSQFLVTGNQEGELRSWNLREMGSAAFINQHAGEVYSIQYTPDNLHVISAGYDGSVKLWSRDNHAEVSNLHAHQGPVTACAVSPDNALWALGTSDGEIKLWSVAEQTFESSLTGHRQAISGLRFLPNGDWIVSSSWDMKLRLWSLKQRRVECNFEAHTKEIAACDVSLDARLAASVGWDCSVRIWDLVNRRRDTGKERFIFEGHRERVLCCSFSPDGNLLATGSADQTIRLWSTEKPTEPSVLHGHTDEVTVCRFTPDGQYLLTGDRNGKILVWNIRDGRTEASVDHSAPVLALAVSPDGLQAAVGDQFGHVAMLDLQYPLAPSWLPASAMLQAPSILRWGAPPTEALAATCLYCGTGEPVKHKQLGGAWTCKKCNAQFMLCPRTLPPVEA